MSYINERNNYKAKETNTSEYYYLQNNVKE